LDVPEDIEISPDRPEAEDPEPTKIEPLFPTEAVPVLRTKSPLTPEGPALAVSMIIEPLLLKIP
jgi:hypothetical protein